MVVQIAEGKPAPKMVRESDLIALRERQRKTLAELAETKTLVTQLRKQLEIAKVNGEEDEAITKIKEYLLDESKKVETFKEELEQRETSLNERDRDSRIKTLATEHNVGYDEIKDAEDPEKEALRLVNQRLVKEKESPAPAEETFESASVGLQPKKPVKDMDSTEFAKEEARLKAEWYAKHTK